VIGWWCKGKTSRNAGRRLRADLIMRGLRQQGIQAEWFDEKRLDRYQCVVFAKRYDSASQDVASRLRARGCRVVIDLCDNHFVYPPDNTKMRDGAEKLRTFIGHSDHVVAGSPMLAEIIARECPVAPEISTIGDLSDDLSIIEISAFEKAVAKIRGIVAARKLSTAAERHTRLVWFGHHGGSRANAGMSDVAKIKPLLERLHREYPIHLSIISSKRKKYKALFADAAFPHCYIEWAPSTFTDLLAMHEIAIIPVELDAFTSCKTDNRVVTALGAGLAVVASDVPSYRRYAGSIQIGDIGTGLREYLGNPQLRGIHARQASQLAHAFTAPQPIIAEWRRVLCGESA